MRYIYIFAQCTPPNNFCFVLWCFWGGGVQLKIFGQLSTHPGFVALDPSKKKVKGTLVELTHRLHRLHGTAIYAYMDPPNRPN